MKMPEEQALTKVIEDALRHALREVRVFDEEGSSSNDLLNAIIANEVRLIVLFRTLPLKPGVDCMPALFEQIKLIDVALQMIGHTVINEDEFKESNES